MGKIADRSAANRSAATAEPQVVITSHISSLFWQFQALWCISTRVRILAIQLPSLQHVTTQYK